MLWRQMTFLLLCSCWVSETFLLLQRNNKAAEGKPVLLDVVICPSAAHLVWCTFHRADFMAEGAMYVDWVAHLDTLVVHDECFTKLFSNKQLLSRFLDLAPTETILGVGNLLEKDLISLNFTSVSSAVQPIIHLLQELVSGRAKESTELLNAKCNRSETHVDVGITSPCGHMVAILRHETLLLKLASLLEQSKVTSSKAVLYAKGALRFALRLCDGDLQHHLAGSCTYPMVRCCQSERSASAESEEEQHLAMKLAQCLLKFLHQAVMLKSDYLEESCTLLSTLLSESNAPVYKAVAAELLRPGKLFTAHRVHPNIMYMLRQAVGLKPTVHWLSLQGLGSARIVDKLVAGLLAHACTCRAGSKAVQTLAKVTATHAQQQVYE